jgi:hypothetical protein
MYLVINQGWHIVVPAISKKTCGFVLLVVLWDVAGSNLVVWRGMGMG